MNAFVAGILTGIAAPFALAAVLLGILAARFAWERHVEDRAQRRPVWERAFTWRDDSLEDFAAWEHEFETEVEP